MNEEIKEILDELQNEDRYIEDYGYEYKRISLEDTKLLLDYITNLQQENESLKEIWKDTIVFSKDYETIVMNTNGFKFYNDYKSRCGKAIEKLSFIDEALENDTLNVPLCITKINSALNILQNGSENDDR